MSKAIFERRKEDSKFGKVINFFKRFFILIGISTTISLVFFSFSISKIMNYTPPALEDEVILYYNFKNGLSDSVQKPSLSNPIIKPSLTLYEITDNLRIAAKDDRVKGFIAKLENITYDIAQYQELRNAVQAFRASGKFAYIYSDNFGGLSNGMGSYYLASSFDKIWLQPVGMVSITGISAEIPFGKDLFKKLGVTPEILHKGKYKSMPESFMNTEMSEPHREMMQAMVGDLYNQITGDIAKDRNFNRDQIKKLVNNAPYLDSESLKLNLVDNVGYFDEMIKTAKDGLNKDIKTVSLKSYIARAFPEEKSNKMLDGIKNLVKSDDADKEEELPPKIALIYGSGAIKSGDGKAQSLNIASDSMNADKIVKAFKLATKDKAVKAIVFRVNSPGGSPAASETIRRAIIKAQSKGIKVIISMGGAAASGGYWISTNADKIIAQPATLTGSIGVFGGKVIFEELWGKIGVNWDGVSVGENADMWSSNKLSSDKVKDKLQKILDNTYDEFIKRVSEGRKISIERAETIAQGRVWTGKQAKDLGLVDELGGLHKAIEIAKLESGLKIEDELPIQQFPRKKSPIEQIIDLAVNGASTPEFKINANLLKNLSGLNSLLNKSENDILKMDYMVIE